LAGLPAYDVAAAEQALARGERAVIQGQQVVELAMFRHRRLVSVN
jgi:hypothetical protein